MSNGAAPERVQVSAKISRKAGTLVLDVAPFQYYLRDTLGVRWEDGRALGRPYEPTSALIDAGNNRITTNALLTWSEVPREIRLADYYANPPSLDALRALGESIREAVNVVLDHYRPVEISVRVVGKGGEHAGNTA